MFYWRGLRNPRRDGAAVRASPYMRIIFSGISLHGEACSSSWRCCGGAGDSRTPFMYLIPVGGPGHRAESPPDLRLGAGFRAWGVAGSATATLIAQAVSFLALVVHLYRTHHLLADSPRMEVGRCSGWNWVRWSALLVAKGIPMGLQLFVVFPFQHDCAHVAGQTVSDRKETAAFSTRPCSCGNYVQMPASAIAGAVFLHGRAKCRGAEKWRPRWGKICGDGRDPFQFPLERLPESRSSIL